VLWGIARSDRRRQLNLTIEGLLGITSAQQAVALPVDSAISDTLQSGHSRDASPTDPEHRLSKDHTEAPSAAAIPLYKYLRVISRTIVTCLCAGTAIILPGFGRVMAFLGSFSAFLICIILPVSHAVALLSTITPDIDPTLHLIMTRNVMGR